MTCRRPLTLPSALAFGFVAACATAASAAPTSLVVSPSGSDGNDCDAAAPCRTIGHAVSVAPPFSRITVLEGNILTVDPQTETVAANSFADEYYGIFVNGPFTLHGIRSNHFSSDVAVPVGP